jgi:hypothetical protein
MGIVKNPPSWSHQSSCFERDSGTGFLLCPSVGPHTPKGILVPPAGGGGSTLRNIDAWSSVLFPAKPEKFGRPSTDCAASDPRAADARKFDVPNVGPPWAARCSPATRTTPGLCRRSWPPWRPGMECWGADNMAWLRQTGRRCIIGAPPRRGPVQNHIGQACKWDARPDLHGEW